MYKKYDIFVITFLSETYCVSLAICRVKCWMKLEPATGMGTSMATMGMLYLLNDE